MSQAAWQKLGIAPIDGVSQPAAYAECTRIARQIARSSRAFIGFLPAEPAVAAPAVALQIARSLADLVRRPIAMIDANVHSPAFPGDQSVQPADAEETMFGTLDLGVDLDLVVPRWVGEVGAGVPQLAAILGRLRHRYAHFLIDLTGFDAIGDHLNALEHLDAAIVVGRAGKTREAQLLAVCSEIPPEVNLGVVLVG